MDRTIQENFSQSFKPTEITSLIKLAESAVRPRLQPGVVINSVLGASECMAVTDPHLLNQVLMGLLTNACKFTTKGTVTFGYEVYDDELYFFVKDTGLGLTPDMKEQLDALFSNNTPLASGLGFGLTIANSLVQKLGGKMGVESRGTGRGSTFWFTIPYSAPSSDDDGSASADESAAAVASAAAAAASGRVTILVAEDNDSNYLLFQTVLKRKYEVVRAVDGLEAIELYKKINPDLIIMDIQMPNMDGYGAVREIRKLSTTVPIIAATAYAFVTDRQRLLENGFNGYISKPINMARLDQEINNCLGDKAVR